MDAAKLEHFRRKILAEREHYRDMVDRLNEQGLNMSQSEAYQEFSMYDNHPADAGTETFEREKDLGLRGNAMIFLQKIDDAVRRIDDGTYGTCEVCGARIAGERLEAMPTSTLCYKCKKGQERLTDREVRPVEEAVLNPPFGRSWRDGTGEPAWDGEDAWQEVARYGTASDVPESAPDYEELYADLSEDRGVVQEVEGMIDETGEPIRDHESDVGFDVTTP